MQPWVAPSNLAEARTRRLEITEQLQEIEAKLGSRNLTDIKGRRLAGREYFEYRDQLIRQKTSIVREIQRLKAYISQVQTEEAGDLAGISVKDDDEKLLLKAYKLFLQLKREEVDFDPSELAFLDVLGKRVGLR
jgi:hypothetical protein